MQSRIGQVRQVWNAFRTHAPDEFNDDFGSFHERWHRCSEATKKKIRLKRSRAIKHINTVGYEICLACAEDAGIDLRLIPSLKGELEFLRDRTRDPRYQIKKFVPSDSHTMLNWIEDIKKRGLEAPGSIWDDARCGYVTHKTNQAKKVKQVIAHVGLTINPAGGTEISFQFGKKFF